MSTRGRRGKRTWRFRLNEDKILEVSAPEGPTEKQVRRRGRVSLVLGTLMAAAMLVGVAGAAVWTDQQDYAPGSVVTISGDNSNGARYLPGETVNVAVSGPNGYTASCEATADDNGAWSCQVTLWDTDQAYGAYSYTATGQQSGTTESGTFTDAVTMQSRESTCSTETNSFTTGATVCMRATGIGGPFPKSGEFKWWAPGLDPASDTATRTQSFSTSNGNAADTYAVSACGTWTVYVYQPAGTKQTEDTFEVTGCSTANQKPVANAGGPYTGVEGDNVQLSGSGTDPDAGDTIASYAWSYSIGTADLGTTCSFSSTTAQNPTISCTDDGTFTVKLIVTDNHGLASDEASAALTLTNANPSATPSIPTSDVNEGDSFNLSLSNPSDPGSNDTFQYQFDCDDGGGYNAASTTASRSCATTNNGSRSVKLKILDDDTGFTEYTGTVNVVNVPPEILSLTCPTTDPVAVNVSVELSGTFSDAGTADTHTASIAWGENGASAGTVTETDGSGSVSGSHTYTTAGIYTPELKVIDDYGDFDTERCEQYVVVYDPSAGFVTGGGWIMSPEGALVDSTLTGKATFGFVSKYKKGANVPDGNTEFQFHAASLNFSSTSYQWLVVGGAKATYKGVGTINGTGNYGFLLSAIDGQINGGGGVDKFRIKIWDMDDGDAVVYDNNITGDDTDDPATVLGGGSIVIHTGKSK